MQAREALLGHVLFYTPRCEALLGMNGSIEARVRRRKPDCSFAWAIATTKLPSSVPTTRRTRSAGAARRGPADRASCRARRDPVSRRARRRCCVRRRPARTGAAARRRVPRSARRFAPLSVPSASANASIASGARSRHQLHHPRQHRRVGLRVRRSEHADQRLADHVVDREQRRVDRVGAQQRAKRERARGRAPRAAGRGSRRSASRRASAVIRETGFASGVYSESAPCASAFIALARIPASGWLVISAGSAQTSAGRIRCGAL